MFKKITETRKSLKQYLNKIPPQIPIRTPEALLANKALKATLHRLPTIVNAPKEYYETLYLATLKNFAQSVQSLPAVRFNHFDYFGGFLELGIERAFLTLQNYRAEYPIHGIAPEKMPAKLALWSYALFTAGLLYGIGDLGTLYYIFVSNEKGQHSRRWLPFDQPMTNYGTHYHYTLETTNYDSLAARIAPILAANMLPPEGFLWIAKDKEVLEYWLAIIQTDDRGSGIFAKAVIPAQEQLIQASKAHATGSMTTPTLTLEPGKTASHTTSTSEPPTTSGAERSNFLSHTPENFIPGASAGVAFTDLDIAGSQTARLGELFLHWLRISVRGHSLSTSQIDTFVPIVGEGVAMVTLDAAREFLRQNGKANASPQQVLNSLQQQDYTLAAPSKVEHYSASTNTLPNAKTLNQLPTQGPLIAASLIYNATHTPPISQDMKMTATTMEQVYPDLIKSSNLYHSPKPER